MNIANKKFNELNNNHLELVIGGEGDFTLGLYRLGKSTRKAVDNAGKFICNYAPWC